MVKSDEFENSSHSNNLVELYIVAREHYPVLTESNSFIKSYIRGLHGHYLYTAWGGVGVILDG